MIADFSHYASDSVEELVDRLALVASELYNAHVVYGSVLGQERAARIHGFMQSSEQSVSGRERDADAQSLHLTIEIYQLQARIKALAEERDLIRLLLDQCPQT